MLTYLGIKNFKIIKALEVDFAQHMTVITGETGAGKSIVIDTLELVLGGRANSNNIIHKDAKRCEITTIFDISNNPEIIDWLIEKDLDCDKECIIRRIIETNGRSKISINDSACSAQTVRELGENLLNLHGQHEQQNLLKTDKQRIILDVFADNLALCAKLKKIYADWLKIKKDFETLQNLNDNGQTKIDFLRYQLEELDTLALQEKELQKLHDEHISLSNADELIATFNNIINITAENENIAILNLLNNITLQLEKISPTDNKIKTTLELFNSATIQIEEAASELRNYLNSTEINQDRLGFVENRLNKIHEIARKHRTTPEQLTDLHKNLQIQLQQLENADAELQKMQQKLQQLENSYLEAASALSKKRKTAALKLNKLITDKMQTLGMEGGEFSVNFVENQNRVPNLIGLESAEFLVTANRGQPLQSLNKVASGGELSRIALAIQVITAEKHVTPILIFDEVDVGIGGKIAEIVGQLLKKLSENAQVICVTHLPQVACCGNHHFKVEKQTTNKKTTISIEKLDSKQRILEIARMLGGIKVGESALKHAKEMLRNVWGQV